MLRSDWWRLSIILKPIARAQILNFIQWHRFQIKTIQERIWYWEQKTLSEFSLMDLFVQKMCTILHLILIRQFNYLATGMIRKLIFDQNNQKPPFDRKWPVLDGNDHKIIIERLNTRYCDNYITNIVDMGNTISMCGTNAGSRKLYTFEKSKILFEKWINENSNVDVGARNVMNSIKGQDFVKVLATSDVGDIKIVTVS